MTGDTQAREAGPRGTAAWLGMAEAWLGSAAALLLVAMTLLTAVDVIGRYFFDRPLTGAFELTELAMGAMVFVSLPLVTLRREHVTVDLMEHLVPKAWRRAQQLLMDAIVVLCLAVITWQLWRKAHTMASAGETTATLEIPIYPLVYAMAALSAITVAVTVALALGDARGAREDAR